jgi:hypothetical protein
VDADHAVAQGLAIRAGILMGVSGLWCTLLRKCVARVCVARVCVARVCVARICGGDMALTVHRAEAICADSVIRVSCLCLCVCLFV